MKIIIIIVVFLLGCRINEAKNLEKLTFNLNEYFSERKIALKNDSLEIFREIYDDYEFGKQYQNDILNNWLKYKYVENFWNRLYKENSIDSVYLSIETRNLSYYVNTYKDYLREGHRFDYYEFVDYEYEDFEVIVLFKEENSYRIASWRNDPYLISEINKKKHNDTTIVYQTISKNKFESFQKKINSQYHPLNIRSFESTNFISTLPKLSVIKILKDGESNVFWVINSKLITSINLDNLLNYFESILDQPIKNSDRPQND